jgi:hypothetical protein
MLIGCPGAVIRQAPEENMVVSRAFQSGHFRHIETGVTYRATGWGSLDRGPSRVYGQAHGDFSDRVEVFAADLDQYEEIPKPEAWEPPYARVPALF